MSALPRWLLVWAVLFAGGLRLLAASKEDIAFNAAARDLRSNSFERADAEFGEFIQTHTNSSRLAEAILYQAEARLKLGKPAGALELLSAHLPQAGKWIDPYLYWLGEAYAQSGDYRKARDTFGDLLQRFPASTNGLKAAVEQAAACSKLEEWSHVLELLQQTNGAFQAALRTRPADEFAQRGMLLLGEAWLRQSNAPQKFAAAEAALQPLANQALNAEIDWRRQELLCRILLGSGRTNEALQNTTNLLAVAVQSGVRERQARSYEFRAGVLEGLGRFDEAIAAYTNNLVDGVPDELRRWALLQSTKLFLAQQKTTNAIQTLERFASQYSDAPAADVALLTLGQLHLGQFLGGLNANALESLPANTPGPTNAIARLEELVQRFPPSAFTAKAQLALGWCFWLRGNWTNALTNFQAAAQNLAPSTDQATAYFKLADTQLRLGQLAEAPARQDYFHRALTNYQRVMEQCATLPEVRAGLEEPALYQIVYAGLAASDLARASSAPLAISDLAAVTNAMTTLLEHFPDGFHTAPAVLLAGQALGRQGNPADARGILLAFATRATNAPSLPLVQLALARTWEEEGNWTNAIRQYNQVLSRCSNPDFCAEAEFGRAQATWRTGDLSNALVLHTNFVLQFTHHPKAPVAQFWVGDYYFNRGNFSAAELNYQQLCENTNWRSSELVYRARMMAGRAAFRQHLWNNAINDFTNLTGNVSCPSNLWVEAMFAYGDCELSQLTKERNDPTNYFHLDQAVGIYNRICERFPNSPQALLALGQKAGALVQLAQCTGNNLHYTNALGAYQILTNSTADITLRSMAEVGMAVAWKWQAEQKSGSEQIALLRQALNACLDVVHGAILQPGERGDLEWTLHAGDMGISILSENLQDWSQASGLCKDMAQLFPSLSERYLERAKTFEARQRNLTRN